MTVMDESIELRCELVADRLYGITIRPHELAVYGDQVRFALRYSPVTEEDEPGTTHFKLLVLEISCEMPEGMGQGPGDDRLELMRCGWELEFTTDHPARPEDLPEHPDEVPHALERIADTANDLARRAGLEAPLGKELIADLVSQYRGAS